jgi:hypothetical protein
MILVVALGTVAPAVAAQAAKSPPGARQAFAALIRQAQRLPKAAAPKRTRARLLADARGARTSSRRAPCKSVRRLNRLRVRLGRIRSHDEKAVARLAALGPASLRVTRALLRDKRTKHCGGGFAPSKLKAPTAKVLRSDGKRLTIRVTMPDLRFGAKTGGGRSWTQLVLPDTDSPQAPGRPGIPLVSRSFAVPEGAGVSVNTRSKETMTINGVDVFPAQADPADDTPPPDVHKPPFADAPFAFDAKAYRSTRPFPADGADGVVAGRARDVQIGAVTIPAAQYTPATKTLKVLRSIDVTIDFTGANSGRFSPEPSSPWERFAQRQVSLLLNGGLVFKPDKGFRPRRCGEELLIVTNPATLAQADRLAAARSAAGIRSRVVQTGAGAGRAGTTNTQIRDSIRAEAARPKCIHPSYVAIMGDDKLVPTFSGVDGIPSDLEYSLASGTDLLPDLAVGRILGEDAAEVQSAVTKIVTYETTPPAASALSRALVAAQFQDDNGDGKEERTFIQFAERVSKGLEARGVHVDRVYRDSPATTPLQFNDGTALPASLQKPGFPWTGDGAQVASSWNAGDFLVVHRDHGWSDGWVTPGFGTGDVDALSNGANLPVLMSINCSSAAYDYDDTSLGQSALVKPDGGAVGVYGDTRDSPTWHNSQIALGFVDGLLPSVLPAEGPSSAQRTGDALVNGKLRLAGLASPATDAATVQELYLWHYFGDPTMQMWGGGTAPLDLRSLVLDLRYAALYQGPPPEEGPNPPYHVTVAALPALLAGQPISLLRSGQVVGKATIGGDGTADIPAAFDAGSPKPGELRVALETDGSLPASFPVPTPKLAPALTQSCPQGLQAFNEPWHVGGALGGAPAGSEVVVTATAPNTDRVERHRVLTDAGGNWTATIEPTDPSHEGGDWTVSSHYAGNDQYAAADAGPCTVSVDSG